MTLTSNIISQSNHAASMIGAGNFNEAIKALTASLHSYKRLQACSLTRKEEHTPREEHFIVIDHCMMSNKSILKNKEEGPCAAPFIHRKAISIPSSSRKIYYKQEEDAILSIILFNLALAFHLSASESKTDTSGSLQKALSFYELAFKQQQGVGCCLDHSNFLFPLAILNNMGTIHCQLKESSVAKHFFHKVLSIMMFLLDSGLDPNKRKYLDGFHDNAVVICCCSHEPHTAAAA